MRKDGWEKRASDEVIEATAEALRKNGFDVVIVNDKEAARKNALALIPAGAEIMNMTSATLDETGIAKEILESGRFVPVRKRLMAMDRSAQGAEMRKMGAAPDWAIGSVQAITRQGNVLMASASGSQLPAYAYGAGRVVWVAGSQKTVKTLDEGFRRIYEHCLPREDARAQKAYGVHSAVNKLLVINGEPAKGRTTIILVKEPLGV